MNMKMKMAALVSLFTHCHFRHRKQSFDKKTKKLKSKSQRQKWELNIVMPVGSFRTLAMFSQKNNSPSYLIFVTDATDNVSVKKLGVKFSKLNAKICISCYFRGTFKGIFGCVCHFVVYNFELKNHVCVKEMTNTRYACMLVCHWTFFQR